MNREFMFSPQHRIYVLLLYKRILVESSYFFDDRTRTYLTLRARQRFRDYKNGELKDRLKKKVAEARKELNLLQRANRSDIEAAMHLLELAYGRKGKVRHVLLEMDTTSIASTTIHYSIHHSKHNTSFPPTINQPYYIVGPATRPPPLVEHVRHTAPPPPLSPPLQALVLHANKKLQPVLPIPPHKPLHPGRTANLLWGHRTKILSAVNVPLPLELLRELEHKATMKEGLSAPVPVPANEDGAWVTLYGILGHPAHTGRIANRELLKLEPELPKPKLELSHLHPEAKSSLIPLRTSRFRTWSIPPSPYAYPSEPPGEPVQPPQEYCLRQVRRMYARLLRDVPVLTPAPRMGTMLDKNVRYMVGESNATVGAMVGEADRYGLEGLNLDIEMRGKGKEKGKGKGKGKSG
ncbi:LOW QUALITY PROTEIN: hypothetical protein BC938DRAFT_472485 [Jimgerdemannia flammicorona]|uniref:LYR motif-containing protein Cup1-like N-terminal domain-containing protein n=1 Tax=Jimgerdemannia flammicorona TaxID=994334 RepID=A0A433Q607_9FUNG|nr:LOW QUALITY PROTEIN: hypothetical protein BC938DRAFT_472485 [Jimgerdemannia flammicorona]